MNYRMVHKGVFVVCSSILVFAANAQTIDPFYSGTYSYSDLGSVPGVPTLYGGITLKLGDPNSLLIGGSANSAAGQIYEIGVTRDGAGHITGFTGTATPFANAPYNDGGVTYGPGSILFASRWPVNELAQYKPGSFDPDKVINMANFGIAQSHSALMFAPDDRPYAGRLKVSSWSGGEFYDATYAPDGSGTYDILSATQTATLVGGPEGYVYVPMGSPLFGDSMLVSEYSAGFVSAYDVDANGDPIEASRKVFISDLSGAEGAMIDPVTGDFLFSTFGGGDRVIVVKGFVVPEPSTFVSGALAIVSLALWRLRRRK